MRKGQRPGMNIIGLAAVALGVLVILALVLPTGFWWLLMGIGLIAVGVFLIKRC